MFGNIFVVSASHCFIVLTLILVPPSRAAPRTKAWNNAVIQAWKRSQADDPVHALARAMREGRGDAVMVKPQWNCPVLGKSQAPQLKCRFRLQKPTVTVTASSPSLGHET